MMKSEEMMVDSIGRSLESSLTLASALQGGDKTNMLIQNVVNGYQKNEEIQGITVIDRDFNIIADLLQPHKRRQKISDVSLSQSILLGKKIKSSSFSGGVMTMSSPLYQGETIVGGFKVTIALNEMQQILSRARTMVIFYIFLAAFLITLFGTFLLNRYMVKPIEKLIQFTKEISEGEFHSTSLIHEKNEIGKLSYSLNRMAERLGEDKKRIEAYISSLEETNRRLEEAQEEVLRSEKLASLGRLSAGIAHEIGNPLGVIRGYIDMLARGEEGQNELKDYCKRIEAEIDRINRIIIELLDYSRVSSAGLSQVDVNQVIQEALSLTSLQKPLKKILLTLKLDEGVPSLMANHHQLVQVIVNLILNAQDALPDGGEITISTQHSEENISVEIHDTGVGIKEEDLPKIFDPFYTTKGPGKGTGLGLAISLRIIESLGGRINVASKVGKGTVFTITFPVVRSS
jgi:hypothetical protein